MRSARDIVAEISREICGSAETIEGLDRRIGEFRREALAQPDGSMARAIAATVAGKLDQVRTALTVTRFAL